ncbi:hypothetical protein N8148_03270 [Gammaproteobacteria bacterium]|nr:hypothetical protein [Gammaproteobacteria bacterium]
MAAKDKHPELFINIGAGQGSIGGNAVRNVLPQGAKNVVDLVEKQTTKASIKATGN